MIFVADSVHDIVSAAEPAGRIADGHGVIIDGGILAELSRTVVRLHKECFGKGPTKARSYWEEDVIVCVLADGFTAAEKTLIQGGRGDLVREQRAAVHEMVKERFRDAIESVAGRRVIAIMGATDEDAQTCSETFILEGPGRRLGSSDPAVLGFPDGSADGARGGSADGARGGSADGARGGSADGARGGSADGARGRSADGARRRT